MSQEQFNQLQQQLSGLMSELAETKQQLQQQQQQQQQALSPEPKEHKEEPLEFRVDSDVYRGILKSEYGKATVQATSSKFTGDSATFLLWARNMKTILSNVGLSELLTNESENQLKTDNTMMILLGGLSSNIAIQYSSLEHPKRLWDSLQSTYNHITETTQSVVRKEFTTCKQGQEEKVKDFTLRLQTCKARMECMNIPVSDGEFKHQLYEGLRDEYASAISQLKLQGVSDINRIMEHIHDQGVMLEAKQTDATNQDTVNYTSNYQKRMNGTNQKNRSNTTNNRGTTRNENSYIFSGTCYNCNRTGHRSRDCRSPIQPCSHCGKTTHVSVFCHSQTRHHSQSRQQVKQHDIAQMVSDLQAAIGKLNSGTTEQANHVNENETPKSGVDGGSK